MAVSRQTGSAVSDQPIGQWSISLLTKFLRDFFENNPLPPLPLIEVDQLLVRKKLVVQDQFTYSNSDWNVVGNTGEPAFEHSWVNYGAPYAKAAFTKDSEGWVHLAGVISSGTIGSTAFTLPPGYRPATDLGPLIVMSNASVGRLDINADGTVVPQLPSSNTNVVLDNIHFKAA